MRRIKMLNSLTIEDWNRQPCAIGDTICIEYPRVVRMRPSGDPESFEEQEVIYTSKRVIGKLKLRLSEGIGIVVERVQLLELPTENGNDYSPPLGVFRKFRFTKHKWYKI